MKKTNLFIIVTSALVITACQSTPHKFNGVTGYQIENKTTTSATIAYTLAARTNQDLDEKKLQHACNQVLGVGKTYKISILSVNEIINTAQQEQYGVKLGNSRATFGLSNSPDFNNSEGYATRQALETRPSTLKVVRYTCS
jgi:predicted small secreted protein